MADFGAIGGFDANKVEPNKPMEVLPAGDYDVVIVKSELKPNKKGTGKLLEMELQVCNGPAQNRKLWDRLNVQNQNPVAQQIALGTLSSICRAVGVLTPRDSSELHMKPLKAKVIVGKDDSGNPRNEVKGYSGRQSGHGGPPSAPVAQQPAPVYSQPVANAAQAAAFPPGSTPWG
jgi:hypothetical protein